MYLRARGLKLVSNAFENSVSRRLMGMDTCASARGYSEMNRPIRWQI